MLTGNGNLRVNNHQVRYDFNKVNNGDSPVCILLQGTAYTANNPYSIMNWEGFNDQNIITFSSGGSGWSIDAGTYRPKMQKFASALITKAIEIYPKVKDFIIIGFSKGGYGISSIYNAILAAKCKAILGICMDAYPSFNTFDKVEKSIPMAYLISNTDKRGHITGRTKDHIKKLITTDNIQDIQNKIYVKQFDVEHGKLEFCIELFNTIALLIKSVI